MIELDLATVVFMVALINLIAPLFVSIHAGLTRSKLGLAMFIAGRLMQGASWLLRAAWLDGGDPVLFPIANALVLSGVALEAALLCNFAKPLDFRRTLGLAVLAAVTIGTTLIATVYSLRMQQIAVSVGLVVLLEIAAFRLLRTSDGGKFQRFMALLYATIPLVTGFLYVLAGSDRGVPGGGLAGFAALAYFCLLVFLQLMGSLGYVLMSKERDTAVLRTQATLDSLSGLLNRRAFFEMAPRLMAAACRDREPVSVLIADLDRFKQINDRFGHQTGDAVIVAFSQGVRASIRQSDLAARFGGDEFVIYLPRAGQDTAEQVAERIRKELHAQTAGAEPRLPLGQTSIGIATGVPRSPEELETLLATADEALYAAKQAGRNRSVWLPLPPPRSPGADRSRDA